MRSKCVQKPFGNRSHYVNFMLFGVFSGDENVTPKKHFLEGSEHLWLWRHWLEMILVANHAKQVGIFASVYGVTLRLGIKRTDWVGKHVISTGFILGIDFHKPVQHVLALDHRCSVRFSFWLKHFEVRLPRIGLMESRGLSLKSKQWSCSELLRGAEVCAEMAGLELAVDPKQMTKDELLKAIKDRHHWNNHVQALLQESVLQ